MGRKILHDCKALSNTVYIWFFMGLWGESARAFFVPGDKIVVCRGG